MRQYCKHCYFWVRLEGDKKNGQCLAPMPASVIVAADMGMNEGENCATFARKSK